MRRRSIASVSSLVQPCGAKASMPGSNRAPPLGAGLEQDVREARRQAPVELVHAEDVAVEELALALGREREPVRLGDVPVHVPLDVGDRRALEDLAEDPVEVVDDLGAAHVEDQLLAALGPRPAGDADRPVRVGAEQLAVRADHLGLDPEPEVEPERGDPLGDAVEPVGQLRPVDEPVAERGGVVVAGAEPAVVEDEQLDAELARRRGDRDEPVGVEVEVGPLPVVDEDRPRAVAPDAAGEPLAVEPVERVGQAAEAVGASRR